MKLPVLAYHIGQRIDLEALRAKFQGEIEKEESSFLLYKLSDQSFIYFKDFGSVVFLNCKDQQIYNTLQFLGVTRIDMDDFPEEKFDIEVVSEQLKVEFDTVIVPYFDEDVAHIIMLNLAQSVAMFYYSNEVYTLIENNKQYLEQLQNSGKVKLSHRKMREIIGKTMNLKHKIAENLYIFETPELAWNEEDLSVLDSKLKKELEIKVRHDDLQRHIDTIKESLDLFKDLLQHRHSSQLEWIIILLILFEVIQVITEKLL